MYTKYSYCVSSLQKTYKRINKLKKVRNVSKPALNLWQ